MTIATLEFNLDKEEDARAYNIAMKAGDFNSLVSSLAGEFKRLSKHHTELSKHDNELDEKTIQHFYDLLYNLLEVYHIDNDLESL